jgi:sugar phosphate isomerase/epimerase
MSQQQADRIGVDYLSMVGASLPDFIRTAAAAGARNVSLFNTLPANFNPWNASLLSACEDAAVRREVISCARDEGVSIALMEGFAVVPESSVEQHRRGFEVLAELGVTRVNSVSFDPSWERTIDEMAALATMGAEYDVTVLIEPCVLFPFGTLDHVLQLIDIVAMPSLKLMIDALHIVRSGDLAALDRIDPALIGYLQLCDGPLHSAGPDAYMYEAAHQRLVPGKGELPLVDIVRHVGPEIIVSGEVPMAAEREAGVSDLDRLKAIVDGISRTLDLAVAA